MEKGPLSEQSAAKPMPVRIVDLSSTITPDLPVRVMGQAALTAFGLVESTEFKEIAGDVPTYYADTYLKLLNHGGAHIDAPAHMERGGMDIGEFPLETFVGRLRVIDLRALPAAEPIAKSHFQNQGIRPGDVVIAFTGYHPPTGTTEWPSFKYLSREAAEYLATIPVRVFGTDAVSVDCFAPPPRAVGYEQVAPVHHAFLSRQIPIIELLENLEQVVGRADGVFVGLPLKIIGVGGNASPVRASVFFYD
jgi:arylformamidase